MKILKCIIGCIYIAPFLIFVAFGFIQRTAKGSFLYGQDLASDLSKWIEAQDER